LAPRLLRYLFFNTLKRFLGSLALLLVIYISIDMVEASSITRSGGVDLLSAYPFKIPSIVTHILPLAAALGVLLSYSHLACAGEWDAMQLAGLSPLRLATALMIVPLAVTMLSVPLTGSFAPALLAIYESRTASESVETKRRGWFRKGEWLVRGFGGNESGESLVIGRDREGRATAWSRSFARGEAVSWRRGKGWTDDRVHPVDLSTEGISVPPVAGAFGLVGASVTSAELDETAKNLEDHGLNSLPLRAQTVLRSALSSACLIVPVLGLLLAMLLRSIRATRLVPLSIAVAAIYWLVLATAWNGASIGSWPCSTVSFGVPGLFAIFAFGMMIRVSLRRI
jgi:lipopolysaccharide export LptBFGC system permease protein LptF